MIFSLEEVQRITNLSEQDIVRKIGISRGEVLLGNLVYYLKGAGWSLEDIKTSITALRQPPPMKQQGFDFHETPADIAERME